MNDNPIYHIFNYLYPDRRYSRDRGQLQIIKHSPGAAGAFTMEGNTMKEYLIRIENNHSSECTYIYGDCPSRPFSIANNLWNYSTPWHAAQRLEKLAKCWENNGHAVKRVYGSVWDMPVKGNEKNVDLIRLDYDWIE